MKLQQVLSFTRRAVDDYHMIQAGDKIAIGISGSYGGIMSITVVAVIFTGILGSVLAPVFIKIFRVNNPMIAGLSIGACSHALGTSKAVELGEVEGAMSGLAIGICGIMTVLFSLLVM